MGCSLFQFFFYCADRVTFTVSSFKKLIQYCLPLSWYRENEKKEDETCGKCGETVEIVEQQVGEANGSRRRELERSLLSL